MEIKKLFIYIGILFFLNGCFQSTAMMGPTMTFVGSGGNIYQAGFTYTANKVVEEETGMSTTEHVSNLVNKDHNKKKKREKKLIKLVKSNYEKTRSNLLRNLVKKNYEKTRKIITTQSND